MISWFLCRLLYVVVLSISSHRESLSRLSRNIVDALATIQILKELDNPVYVYFEKENIHTKDPKSDLLVSVMGSIAQEESINMGESMAWGRRKYAERGIIRTGKVTMVIEVTAMGSGLLLKRKPLLSDGCMTPS